MNSNSFAHFQAIHDAKMPRDRLHPTDEEIAAYAAHIKPLLLASREDVPDLLAMAVGGPEWENFALSLNAGCNEEAGRLARVMLDKAASDDAERIASDELYGDEDHSDTLRRIGASDVATFFKRQNEERAA